MAKILKLRNGIVIDEEKSLGKLKFLDKKAPSLVLGEDGEPTGEIKDRRYDILSKLQHDSFTVILPAETEEKNFPFNSTVKLINPVVENYAIPNGRYVDSGIRVTADDIVLVDKGEVTKIEPSKPTTNSLKK
ncbi:YdcP family protein [Ligilactobacillus sp. WILCCON 0076]|uniref:YdcP family protein n=1 Tax=Ligilactobacillus ubinensis TaxID=2876789 RepID=A0A9X2FNL4_9LACO|nr:DUF961 family protein [Ligilactobacillus ubinensis]MCP0887348.1 YdcP family protein [Ligilactobacillus ubinensis]